MVYRLDYNIVYAIVLRSSYLAGNFMTSEERQILERVAQMAEQNNKMLRHLYRSMIWSRITQIVYWLIIIAIAFGTYYIVQPYLGPLSQLINKMSQITGVKL